MAICESLPVLLVLDCVEDKVDTAERIGFLNLAAHRRPGDDQVRSLMNTAPLEIPPPLDPPPLLKRMREIRLQ